MKKREVNRLGQKITRKVIKYWGKHDPKERQDFDMGLSIIIRQIAKHCKIPTSDVGKHTSAVIEDFIAEYKEKIPLDLRGHETIISMLYALYMKHLEKI